MAPLRASLARSPPRLGRSQAGGLHPQTPRAAPPGAPSRTGPLLPRSPSRRGSGHGCARWPGWSTACGCPRWTPSPWRFSGFGRNSKVGSAKRCGGSGGVPPVVGRRWATRPRRWAVRVQPQAVPAVHGLGEVVHGRPGSGRSGRGCFSPERQRWQRHATHRVRRKGRKPAPVLDPLHLWHASPTLVACQPDTFRAKSA